MFYLKSQVERLLAEKDKQIKMYSDQAQELKEQVARERERAENAIDQLLFIKGAGSVTPIKAERKTDQMIENVMQGFSRVGEDVEESVK